MSAEKTIDRARFPLICACVLAPPMVFAQTEVRPRIRDLGVHIGILQPGPLNAITDVAGVRVGQTTLIRGDNVRTGVTAILPHGGNLFKEKVPGAVFVGNAFGKLIGSTQVNELGEIETPILLTSTLSVGRVADSLIGYMLKLPGDEDVKSVNPLVGETNDGYLNDIRSRPIMVEEAALAGLEAPEDRDVEGLGARECAAALQEVPQVRDLVTVAEFRGHIKEQISGDQLCSRQPPFSFAVAAFFCTRKRMCSQRSRMQEKGPWKKVRWVPALAQ